jgi:hypothetical protein
MRRAKFHWRRLMTHDFWRQQEGIGLHIPPLSMTSRNASTPRRTRSIDVIKSITTPLGFYVLALLIVEATLAIVLTSSKLNSNQVWSGFLWMIGIFIGTLVIVTLFAALKPQHLLFGKEEHLAPMLEPSALRDQIEDLIQENVKPEALIRPKNTP